MTAEAIRRSPSLFENLYQGAITLRTTATKTAKKVAIVALSLFLAYTTNPTFLCLGFLFGFIYPTTAEPGLVKKVITIAKKAPWEFSAACCLALVGAFPYFMGMSAFYFGAYGGVKASGLANPGESSIELRAREDVQQLNAPLGETD